MKYFLFLNLFNICFANAQTFSPTNISGIKLWLSSDSVNTSSGKVNTWYDLSGNNNHAIQTDPTKKPDFITSINLLNNKPVLRFGKNGNSGDFTTLDFPQINILPNNLTIIVLYKRLGVINALDYLISDIGKGMSVGGTSYTNTIIYDGSSVFEADESPLNYSFIEFNNNNAFRNGNLFSTAGTIGSMSFNTIGARADALNLFYYGDIAEIIIYNKILNTIERSQIDLYLNDKYAPPISLPPDISSPNSFCDTTIIANGAFTNYQWSTGATTPTISVNKGGKYWVNGTNIFGKTSSDTIIVNLPNYNPPTQNFICSNSQLAWNTQLSKSNYTFLWQDNSIDSVFTITQPGNYYVKINDSFGCSITSDTVKIVEDNFSTTASLGPDVSLCSGNSITLTSGATQSLTYTWSTGSNNDSLLITTSGQYSVVVTNTNNCVAKDTINVSVLGQAPTANFISSVGCYNSAVSFTNLSIPPSGNTITNTNWNFGDSSSPTNTSTATNPFHTFSDTGIYFISLNVITDSSCEQTITKTIHIAPTPTVNFTNGLSCQNDSTAFSSSIISTPGYSVTSFAWNFGDPVSGTNNTSNLSSPKHLFSNQTSYSVTLVATNNAGCSTSKINIINVKAEVKASFTNSPPCSNTAVIFQDNSIAPPSSTRLWNFGILGTQSGLTATKTYTSSGVYSVTLTVTGTNLCTSKITKQIIVFLPPAVNFTVPSFCSKDTITATNQSVAQSGIISSYNWKLNNTTFSAAQSPTLTASAGTYSVKLVVTNSFNCKDSLTKPVTVLPLPNVDFTTNPPSYYFINDPITFIPTITNASSYLWNITGVSTSTIQSPTINFTAEGSYTASLNLQDQQGCENSKTKTILVSKRYLDLAVLNVNTIKDNNGFITVEADVVNYGSVPVTSFDIHYQISDAGNVMETWNGTLNPNAFYVYTFIAKSATQKNTTNNITCVEIEKANGVVDENTGNNNLCNTLNTDEISVSNPIPNPTDGDITLPIILNKDIDFTIAIYNSTGQIVYEETTQKGIAGLNFVTLLTSSYARGCYIIKTTIDDKIFIKKFIKIGSK